MASRRCANGAINSKEQTMKGKKNGMKSGMKQSGTKAYNEHSADKRRSQDPASVMNQSYDRATKGGE